MQNVLNIAKNSATLIFILLVASLCSIPISISEYSDALKGSELASFSDYSAFMRSDVLQVVYYGKHYSTVIRDNCDSCIIRKVLLSQPQIDSMYKQTGRWPQNEVLFDTIPKDSKEWFATSRICFAYRSFSRQYPSIVLHQIRVAPSGDIYINCSYRGEEKNAYNIIITSCLSSALECFAGELPFFGGATDLCLFSNVKDGVYLYTPTIE